MAIRLWNDEIGVGNKNAKCTLVFKQSYPLRDLILSRDLNRLAGAHINGVVDTEGDFERFFDLVDYLQGLFFHCQNVLKFFFSDYRHQAA